MTRPIRSIFLLACATVLLAGCGKFKQEREPWRRQAELVCLRENKIKAGDYIKPIKPIDGDWSCGADYPLKVSAFANEVTGSIPGGASESLLTGISPDATLVCPMVAAMDEWLADVIQPAAMARFGQPVAQIKTMGSYSCRPRNNQSGAKLSEHGFANAVDVAGFSLADGRFVSIVKHWKSGTPEEQAFLREVHLGACKFFTTVLGPGANIYHYNHIHVDLARHGVKGNVHYCRPILNAADIPQTPPPGDLNDPARFERNASGYSPAGGAALPDNAPRASFPAASAYPGRPGPNPAAPVYSQPVVRDLRPAPLHPQSDAAGSDADPEFQGNDDENVDVSQFDIDGGAAPKRR